MLVSAKQSECSVPSVLISPHSLWLAAKECLHAARYFRQHRKLGPSGSYLAHQHQPCCDQLRRLNWYGGRAIPSAARTAGRLPPTCVLSLPGLPTTRVLWVSGLSTTCVL